MSEPETPAADAVAPETAPPISLAKVEGEYPKNVFIHSLRGMVLYPAMVFPMPIPEYPFQRIVEQVEQQ